MTIPLQFAVVGARTEPYAAVPTIMLRLRITTGDGRSVHALALRGQIRIEPQRRRYDAGQQARLHDLFGEPSGWGDSLRPFLWTHVSTMVAGFTGTTEVDLPVECSYDFEVAGARYLHALASDGDGQGDDGEKGDRGGEVPLVVLFSGTAFGPGREGAAFAAEPVSWSSEAAFRLPVAVWRSTMDQYFPGAGWLRLDRATLDALGRFKTERALPTWDQAVEQLLKEARAGEGPP
jgi:hypothetical protein